jgi:hypothetical protein
MPMGDTDKRIINGLIWLCVIGAAMYFLPAFSILGVPICGYRDFSQQEETTRDGLKNTTSRNWQKYYAPMHPAHWGESSADPLESSEAQYLEDVKDSYGQNNLQTNEQIDMQKTRGRMSFPQWTEIPDNKKKEPGVYFDDTWKKLRYELEDKWRKARVECLDPDIGFTSYKGLVVDENTAKEYLRELFITQKIIELCISAKLDQERREREKGFQPEAFMKIFSVSPRASEATGPSALVPNPNYKPDERNPLSDKAQPFKLQFWRNFIQEYPVEIVLQCDINTFERFLYRVRTPGQFLVIRSLEIVSPLMNESKDDATEVKGFLPKTSEGPRLVLKDEHVLVRMSAAGMDFFDPEKFTTLYSKNQDEKKNTKTRRHRIQTQ